MRKYYLPNIGKIPLNIIVMFQCELHLYLKEFLHAKANLPSFGFHFWLQFKRNYREWPPTNWSCRGNS